MAYGKQAAQNIDLQLTEVRRWEKLFPKIEYELRVPENPSESRRHGGHELVAIARAKSEEEVVTGLSGSEAVDEACRCLRCDVKVEA
jgi:NADH-quinone oxidoreductase subunit F